MRYLIWILILLLIGVRYFLTKPKFVDGDKVRITSTVYSDPVTYEKSQYIKLGGLKVYMPLFPEVYYGNKIVVEGVVDNGKLKNPKVISIREPKNILTKLRQSIISFYNRSLPQPESGLLAGIVLGAKGALTQEFYNQTKLVGVAHVVVASGTNVTFVVNFLMGLLVLVMSRKKAIYFCILGIILYLFVSGFEAPLVRAAIMSSVLFLSQETGRLVNTWRILFITAGIMLIVNPLWLTDIGFILSFVSTTSLMLFQQKINKKVQFLPRVIREGFSTSLAAQIGVSPILFVTFGQFNIFSVLVNALVLWTVPFLMILGAIGGILKLKFILLLAYPFLWWFKTIVNMFSF